MRTQTLNSLRVSSVIAVAVAFNLLASSFAADRKAMTVGLTEIRKNISALQEKTTSTIEALESLKAAGKAGGDIKGAYGKFETRLKALDEQTATVRSQGIAMRANAADHYKAWQEQLMTMQNPKLRDKAQNRFDEAKQEFDQIISSAEEAKRDFAPFMADLNDVNSYLRTDLSVDSVKSLNSTIWKLGIKSGSVTGGLRALNEQITKTLELQPQ